MTGILVYYGKNVISVLREIENVHCWKLKAGVHCKWGCIVSGDTM